MVSTTLSDDEKRMLQGEQGSAIRKAMEFLVEIGDANGADEMVDVSCGHILAVERTDLLYELVSKLIEGVRARIPTTSHALPFNLERMKGMKLPESVIEEMQGVVPRLKGLHRRLGAVPAYTCLPYSFHYLRLGEHVAFTDSQVVPVVNSWFGARTNMETPASAIASAITGKTPKYGLHLAENRWGGVLIEIDPIEAQKFDYADYGALSFWAGKLQINGIPAIPVYKGLLPTATLGEAKYMSLPHTWHSGLSMFHVVGVTPEASTVEVAFGSRRVGMKCIFGKREIKETYEELTSATEEKVDLVCLGCPHCTLSEVADIAKLISGMKIHENTQLWVGTSWMTRTLAKQMGFVDIIEGAGGLVISDACVAYHPVVSSGASVMATNAAAPCRLVPLATKGRTAVWFGKTAACINAAIKGKWEAN